mgnify:CR=1 FL=1
MLERESEPALDGATLADRSFTHRVDLDPARNYVFAVHPHGIISAGVWANVLGQGNGPQSFEKLFPGSLRAAHRGVRIWRAPRLTRLTQASTYVP